MRGVFGVSDKCVDDKNVWVYKIYEMEKNLIKLKKKCEEQVCVCFFSANPTKRYYCVTFTNGTVNIF